MLTARENSRAGEYYGKSGVLQPHFNQFLEDFLSILTIKLCWTQKSIGDVID